VDTHVREAASCIIMAQSRVTKPVLGSILLEIISASNLPAVDKGSADPFVYVSGGDGLDLSVQSSYGPVIPVNPADGRYGYNRNQTISVDRCLNPTWNFKTELFAHTTSGYLLFSVYDYNSWSKNIPMGEGRVSMQASASDCASRRVVSSRNTASAP
jgi:Ca2+-dependent lipid-binding protein